MSSRPLLNRLFQCPIEPIEIAVAGDDGATPPLEIPFFPVSIRIILSAWSDYIPSTQFQRRFNGDSRLTPTGLRA
jgi:hypothetical protein